MAVRLTPPAILREPPTRAKTLKEREEPVEPRDCAVPSMLLLPPTRVRLLTPPKVPASKNEEDTLALRGSTAVEPDAMVMEEI